MEEFKLTLVYIPFSKRSLSSIHFTQRYYGSPVLINFSILSLCKDIEAEFVTSDFSLITVPHCFFCLLFGREVLFFSNSIYAQILRYWGKVYDLWHLPSHLSPLLVFSSLANGSFFSNSISPQRYRGRVCYIWLLPNHLSPLLVFSSLANGSFFSNSMCAQKYWGKVYDLWRLPSHRSPVLTWTLFFSLSSKPPAWNGTILKKKKTIAWQSMGGGIEITFLGKVRAALFPEFPRFSERPLDNLPSLCCAVRWERGNLYDADLILSN